MLRFSQLHDIIFYVMWVHLSSDLNRVLQLADCPDLLLNALRWRLHKLHLQVAEATVKFLMLGYGTWGETAITGCKISGPITSDARFCCHFRDPYTIILPIFSQVTHTINTSTNNGGGASGTELNGDHEHQDSPSKGTFDGDIS